RPTQSGVVAPVSLTQLDHLGRHFATTAKFPGAEGQRANVLPLLLVSHQDGHLVPDARLLDPPSKGVDRVDPLFAGPTLGDVKPAEYPVDHPLLVAAVGILEPA